MGLPSTGELSFLAIRTELGISGAIDLNNSRVRGLAGKASGTISFSDLRGKSSFVNTATTFGNLPGYEKWIGGVLAPNGKIYGIPASSTTVLEIDPVTKTATTFGNLPGSWNWYGGVLAPNGKIYGIPFDSTTILEIDVGS